MVKTRRLPPEVTVESGLPESTNYCRKCKRVRRSVFFYKAVDLTIDSNEMFSVCKECIDDIYIKVLESEHGAIQKAVLYLCRKLNVKYDEAAIESAMKQIESSGWDINKFFGVYRAKLVNVSRSTSDAPMDLSYMDNPIVNLPETKLSEEEFVDFRELVDFWGTDVREDIEFLEFNFSKFKQSHKADTYAEVVLLKEVCYKMLEIDRERKVNGKAPDSSTKQLMEIMKNLAISPNMVSAANSGKNVDTFGIWIKEIESMRPAEWVEDKSIYADVDNIEAYGERHLTSPMRSLVTGNREFSLDESETDYSSEEE